jgi:hypothetical protein
MKKPSRCLLTFHDRRLMVNDDGQRYKTCSRCGAYRDLDSRHLQDLVVSFAHHGVLPGRLNRPSSRQPAAVRSPLTGEAVSFIQGVIADARDRSPILDARQESGTGARNIHGAEGTAGVDEAVAFAGGVAVKPAISRCR